MPSIQCLKHSGTGIRIPRLLVTLLVGVAILAGASCGPKVIKGRPPFVSISSMQLVDDTLTATFDMSNQNGVEMNIDLVEIEVSVTTTELTRYDSQASLLIGANSTEEVSVAKTPDDFTRKLLVSLDNGQLDSLSFDLGGRVHTAEDGNLRFEQKGFLYPVPGRPGQYRAAVTQAKGLVRDKPR